jgi:LysM repeat protein
MVAKTLLRAKTIILLAIVVVALVFPSAVEAKGQVHVVQRGENLYRIALHYGTSVQAIMNANGLHNANFIWVGQRLVIPGKGGGSSGGGGGSSSGGGGSSAGGGGSVYVVQRGDNLAGIARRYGTTVAAIVSANGLRNPNFIYAGQRLRIPGGGGGGGGSPAPAPSGGGGGGGKWIDVDLSSQTTRAYQGNTVVRSMVVSTGIARYPTPTGRFRIYAKYRSTTMSGPGYYLTGVPHTMYFYRGYALHGTYWHNNFGHPMSHGCINLTNKDARFLYNWASYGTPVVVHR